VFVYTSHKLTYKAATNRNYHHLIVSGLSLREWFIHRYIKYLLCPAAKELTSETILAIANSKHIQRKNTLAWLPNHLDTPTTWMCLSLENWFLCNVTLMITSLCSYISWQLKYLYDWAIMPKCRKAKDIHGKWNVVQHIKHIIHNKTIIIEILHHCDHIGHLRVHSYIFL